MRERTAPPPRVRTTPGQGGRKRWGRVTAGLVAVILVAFAVPAPVGAGPQLPRGNDTPPSEAERSADEILDGDDYRGPDPDRETWGDRLRQWLSDRLPDGPQVGSRNTDAAATIFVGVLALGALVGTIWLVVSSRRTKRVAEGGDDDATIEVTPLRSPREWADEASRCEARGDWRGAVRARYRGLTGDLAGRGVVVDVPGRTAGEHRREVSDHAPAAAPAFTAAAQLFERVFYGGTQAEATDAERVRSLAVQTLEAAPRRVTAGGGEIEDGTEAADGVAR